MRRTGLAVGAIATTVALAACGDDDGGTSVTITEGKGGGVELFEAMTDAQLEAETATFEMSMTMSGGLADGGGVDASGQMRMTSETTVDMTMQMTTSDAAGGDVELALNMIDGVVYTDMFNAQAAAVETPWVSIDPSADDPVSQLFGQFFAEQQEMADTTALFAENPDLFEVEEGDGGEVDGQDATEYLVTADVDELVEAGGLSLGQMPATGEFPVDTITYHLWVNDDLHPLQITFDMEIDDTTVAMNMAFSDWGESVTIEGPPESDVTPIGDAITEMMGVDELSEEDLEMLEQTFGV